MSDARLISLFVTCDGGKKKLQVHTRTHTQAITIYLIAAHLMKASPAQTFSKAHDEYGRIE